MRDPCSGAIRSGFHLLCPSHLWTTSVGVGAGVGVGL